MPGNACAIFRRRFCIVNFINASDAIGKPGAICDLDIQSRARIHLENHRPEITLDHRVHTQVTQPCHFIAARSRLQNDFPVWNLQS